MVVLRSELNRCDMNNDLLKPREVDIILRYPRGRSQKLAKRGLIPHVLLPDGEIRFDRQTLSRWLTERSSQQTEACHAG